MAGFEELETWKKSRDFRNRVIQLSKSFPSDEKFRLVDQLTRASRSITANIAEGHGKYHWQENIRACRIARGSLNEVLDHLIAARDSEYLSAEELVELR